MKKIAFALLVSSLLSAPAWSAGPTHDEVMKAIKEVVKNYKEGFDTAGEAYPKNHLCNIWGYLEPVDYTVVDQALSADKVKYKLNIQFKWTESMATIVATNKCTGNSYVSELGMPVQGTPGGNPFFKKPFTLLMGKFDKGWILMDN